jgi:hypothetical protein
LIGAGPVGSPGLCNACRLLNSHAMPAFRERGRKGRVTKWIGLFLDTKDGHILLTERKIDRSKRIQGSKLAWIGLDQADMRHRFGDGLPLDSFLSALALLLQAGCSLRLLPQGNERVCTRSLSPMVFFYTSYKAVMDCTSVVCFTSCDASGTLM